jgi:hypothetical protein
MIVFYQFTKFEKYQKRVFWVIPFSVTPSKKKVDVVFFVIFSIKIPFQHAQAFGSTAKID